MFCTGMENQKQHEPWKTKNKLDDKKRTLTGEGTHAHDLLVVRQCFDERLQQVWRLYNPDPKNTKYVSLIYEREAPKPKPS